MPPSEAIELQKNAPALKIPNPQPQPSISNEKPVTAITLLLQWLMYAFYGWALIAFIYLISSTVYYYLNGKNAASYASLSPYAITAIVILLGIAVLCNVLYQKNEPSTKKGSAAAIMIIHAVIFALFAIGALIATIFIIVAYYVSGNGESSVVWAGFITGLLVFLLYAVTFIRTINPPRFKWINRTYMIGMIAVATLLIVFAIIGPTLRTLNSKNDQLIENNIGSVATTISDKLNNDGTLPESLSSLNLSGNALKITMNNILTYIPNSLPASYPYFYYELCANFKYASSGYNSSTSTSQNADDSANYSDFPNYSSHPSGHYCYLVSVASNSPILNSSTSTTSNN